MAQEALNFIGRLEELSNKLDIEEREQTDILSFFNTLPFPAFIEIYGTKTYVLEAKYKNLRCLEIIPEEKQIIKNPKSELKKLINLDSITEANELECSSGIQNVMIKKWVYISLKDESAYIFGIITNNEDID